MFYDSFPNQWIVDLEYFHPLCVCVILALNVLNLTEKTSYQLSLSTINYLEFMNKLPFVMSHPFSIYMYIIKVTILINVNNKMTIKDKTCTPF